MGLDQGHMLYHCRNVELMVGYFHIPKVALDLSFSNSLPHRCSEKQLLKLKRNCTVYLGKGDSVRRKGRTPVELAIL